jgi:hypothetical protein
MKKLRYNFWKLIGWLFRYPIKQVLLLQEPEEAEKDRKTLRSSPDVWEHIIMDQFSKIEQNNIDAEKTREEFYRSDIFKNAFVKLINKAYSIFQNQKSGEINISCNDVGINSNDPNFTLFHKNVVEIFKDQQVNARSYGDTLICIGAKSFGKMVLKIKNRRSPLPEMMTEGPYR